MIARPMMKESGDPEADRRPDGDVVRGSDHGDL
jgi:hypothetical protein